MDLIIIPTCYIEQSVEAIYLQRYPVNITTSPFDFHLNFLFEMEFPAYQKDNIHLHLNN